MKTKVHKRYLKTWAICGYYQYNIYEINAGGETWLEAEPVTKGVTRTAENEQILRIILTNDAKCMNKFYQRIR